MDKNDGLQSMAEAGGGAEGAIITAQRLNRFMLKLLGELQHLGGDRILFKHDNQLLHLTLSKKRTEIKSLPLRSAWFEPITSWFLERVYVFGDEPRIPPIADRTAFTMRSLVRLGNQGVRVQVERAQTLKGMQTLTCDFEGQEPVNALVSQLQVSFEQRRSFDYLLHSSQGTLIVGAPDEEQQQLTTAALLSLTGGFLAGDLGTIRAWSDVGTAADESLVVCTARAADATDLLPLLREVNVPRSEVHLLGAIIQGFAPCVCSGCAKSSVIEPELSSRLPSMLQPPAKHGYAVGRGCERCQQRGTKGTVGIQSVFRMTPDLEAALAHGATLAELVERTYAQGTRSLIEDGFHKAMRGAVTLECLFRVTHALPPVYQALLSREGGIGAPAPDRPTQQLRTTVLADDAAEPVIGSGSETRRATRARARILVVEDDPDQRQILEMVFRSAGYDVSLAEDGISALERVQSAAPDLIVADLMMPRMDGAELVRRLKADPVRKKIPVLILTVVSDLDKEYSLLEQGADDYCEKTIQRRILLKRVENLVRRSHKSS